MPNYIIPEGGFARLRQLSLPIAARLSRAAPLASWLRLQPDAHRNIRSDTTVLTRIRHDVNTSQAFSAVSWPSRVTRQRLSFDVTGIGIARGLV